MAPFPGAARVIPAMVCFVGVGAMMALVGCEESTDSSVAKVKLNGKTFFLEIVADDAKRFLGLGNRDEDSLKPNGGMLFVFPNSETGVKSFVMRDCKIDIDIIFLDSAGRILAMHNMKKEDARREGETDDAYNDRLKKYSSRYPSQFVIEIKGGLLQSLNLKEGDIVNQKWDELKKLAK